MNFEAFRESFKRPGVQIAAVLSVVLSLHLVFFIQGSYTKSYDAYTHMFLSSHWYQHWWQDFEPRWYTGFSIHSYPPFAHQIVAFLAFVMGLEMALLLAFLLSLLGIGLGMYRYTRLWFDHSTAVVAAACVLLLPGVTMTTHLFGQYPNLVSLALTLNLLPYAAKWLQGGKHSELIKGELLLIAVACTSLFANFMGILFFVLPLLFLPVEKTQRVQYGWRLAVLFVLGLITLLACLWPFFAYLQANPVQQVPIPHASRGNVLAWTELNYFTFYGLYGLQLVVFPLLLVMALRQRRYWGFALSFCALFLFSLGGATVLNRMIFGSLFNVLTFDRFAYWNGVLLTPLMASICVLLWNTLSTVKARRLWQSFVFALLALPFFAIALANMASPFWKPLPRPLDVHALAQAFESKTEPGYRYLTLGIGSYNLSGLSVWTQRQNLDGNYNLARRLPELTASPVGQLDDAKYYGDEGLNTIAKFLLNPAKYQLKYVILGDLFYTPLLQTAGWYQKANLPEGLSLWESSLHVDKLAEKQPHLEPWHWRLYWGVLPLLAFFLALCLMGYDLWRRKQEAADVV